MSDTREDILARLLVIAAGLSGVNYTARNLSEKSDRKTPSIIIYDADESPDESLTARKGPRTPMLVTMQPEIAVDAAGTPEAVGTAVNAIRFAFIQAVLNDDVLPGLVGSNGEYHYLGGQSDLGVGRSITGKFFMSFSFTYPLFP